jgi:hypothetical protein
LRARFTFAALALCLVPFASLASGTETDTPSATITDTDSPTATDTSTPTPTATASATATPDFSPTPGEGSLVITPTTLVSGSSFNTFQMTYQAGPSSWPASGGLLTIFFPVGLGTPSSANFYVQPSQANLVVQNGYSFNGQTASVQVAGLAPNSPITFWYGYDPAGVYVSSTQAAAVFTAFAYPQSVTLGAGGAVGVTPGALLIVTATQTPTATQTATITMTSTITTTFTISPTFSLSPTLTTTTSFTASPTITPLGAIEPGSLYSYPNPFDMSRFDKCTFRFPVDPTATVTVFNLLGEPVRELPSSDINGALGWAVWYGVDDRLRKVPGGLYFVRVRGQTTRMRRFTVLN